MGLFRKKNKTRDEFILTATRIAREHRDLAAIIIQTYNVDLTLIAEHLPDQDFNKFAILKEHKAIEILIGIITKTTSDLLQHLRDSDPNKVPDGLVIENLCNELAKTKMDLRKLRFLVDFIHRTAETALSNVQKKDTPPPPSSPAPLIILH